MTFREMPRWMRIWIVLAFILLAAGVITLSDRTIDADVVLVMGIVRVLLASC